jgi:hypothetical protein
MKRYIGLDVHAASTTFAVTNETGRRLGSHVVETNGHALVEQLTVCTAASCTAGMQATAACR